LNLRIRVAQDLKLHDPYSPPFRCRFFVRGKTKGGARLW
jgi:hypothetical protein